MPTVTGGRAYVRSTLGIAVGTAITASGLNLFLIPSRLNDGGVTAIAIVLHLVAHLPTGPTLFVLNVPLFLLAWWRLGLPFVVRSLIGTVLLSVWLEVIPEHALVHDVLLASVYGGLVSGLGTGIVFRFGGSTGGTDLVAWVLRLVMHWTSGRSLLVVDAVVIALTGVVLGASAAMYSAFALFVGTRAVDFLQEGSEGEKVALVITGRAEAVGARVLAEMGRGATLLSGQGLYSGESRPVLLVALGRREIPALKAIVSAADATAFMLVLPAGEVLGEGFAEFLPAKRRRGQMQ